MSTDTKIKITIDAIIISFTGIYGPRFVNFLEKSDMNLNAFRREWSLGIAGLTTEQVQAAIDLFRLDGSEWPPGIGEFVNRALDVPSPSEIAIFAGGDIGDLVLDSIGDSYTLRTMSASELRKHVNIIYKQRVNEIVSNHLEHEKISNPEVLGYEGNNKIKKDVPCGTLEKYDN